MGSLWQDEFCADLLDDIEWDEMPFPSIAQSVGTLPQFDHDEQSKLPSQYVHESNRITEKIKCDGENKKIINGFESDSTLMCSEYLDRNQLLSVEIPNLNQVAMESIISSTGLPSPSKEIDAEDEDNLISVSQFLAQMPQSPMQTSIKKSSVSTTNHTMNQYEKKSLQPFSDFDIVTKKDQEETEIVSSIVSRGHRKRKQNLVNLPNSLTGIQQNVETSKFLNDSNSKISKVCESEQNVLTSFEIIQNAANLDSGRDTRFSATIIEHHNSLRESAIVGN